MPIILAGLGAMLLYSGSFVATRHAMLAGLQPADVMMLRYAVGGLACALVLARIGLGGLRPWQMAVLTLLGGLPYFAMQVFGVGLSSASHAAVLNPGGTVIFAILLGWWLLREVPGRGALAALPLLLLGLLAIAGAGLGGVGLNGASDAQPGALAGLAGDGRSLVWLGDTVLLISGAQWALYGTLLRAWGVQGLRAACVISAFSLPYVALHLVVFGGGSILAHPGEALGQAVFQGIMVGLVANALYSHCYAVMGPGRAAIFPPLVPVLGTLLAAWVLGENVTTAQAAGMALVVGGMLLAGLWRRPAWVRRPAAIA